MVYRIGRVKRLMAAGMMAMALLSGCGSDAEEFSAVSVPPIVEEGTEKEDVAGELQKQLMAIINLDRSQNNQVASDSSLTTAAEFYLSYVIQNPQAYLTAGEEMAELQDLLPKNTYLFVYDGGLSAGQAGKEMLQDLQETASQLGKYMELNSIAVLYGEGDHGSAWLLLARAGTPRAQAAPSGEETGA